MCVCGLDVGGRSAVVESWHSLSSVTRAYFVTLTPSPLILACSLPPHYGHPADACCIASAAILTYMYERGIDILYTAAFSISLTSPHMGKGNAGPWAALSPHAVGRETTSTAAAAQEAPPTHKAPAPCDFRKRKKWLKGNMRRWMWIMGPEQCRSPIWSTSTRVTPFYMLVPTRMDNGQNPLLLAGRIIECLEKIRDNPTDRQTVEWRHITHRSCL